MDILEQLLDEYGVDFITTGQNSSKAFVNIQCELDACCGGDYKYKRGIHRSMCYSVCWAGGRTDETSVYHVSQMLGIPWKVWCENMEDASEEYGVDYKEYKPITDIEDHEEELFMEGDALEQIHIDYLSGVRGFDSDWLQKEFGIRGTTFMPYEQGKLNLGYRIMIPIYYQGKLISYQGRSVQEDARNRYLCCPPEEELRFHKALLYNIDRATSKKVILVEGVFDALKLIQASGNYNIVASYGTAIEPQQLQVLRERYDEVFILYDPEEKAQQHAEEIKAYMEQFGKKAHSISLKGDADPGDLSLEVGKFVVETLLGVLPTGSWE